MSKVNLMGQCGVILLVFCLCSYADRGNGRLQLYSVPVTAGSFGKQVDGLQLDEIDEYARMAQELRAANDLPAGDIGSAKGRLDLAIELAALALQARATGAGDLPAVGERTKRLLARVYLDRLVAASDRLPVSDSEVRAAHEREKARYMATGESDIFRPSSLDVIAVAVGYFPDMHVPEHGEQLVCARDVALELGRKIHVTLAGAAADLDAFLAAARRFQVGHPTVVIKEYWKTLSDPQLSGMDSKLHQAVCSLPAEGDLSEAVVTERGVFVARRGCAWPGKGERLAAVRDVLVDRIRTQRRHALLKKQLSVLLEQYGARTWPERLASPETAEAPGAVEAPGS
ncbi:MAG TPA: hypothetical protein VM425_07305, partial [Myxococcota bacterium]|nr:hypothetical protein [Myxococcota bacterium]